MGCCEKVWSKSDGTSKWAGLKECKGKVVVTSASGKTYCKRHAKRAAEYEAALNYGKK